MKPRTFFMLFVALGMGAIANAALAIDAATLKAGYLYNFAKFIQWPDEQRATLRLCVLGDEAAGRLFDSLIGKPVRNMRISVRHEVNVLDIPQCDLVFVPGSNVEMLGRVQKVVNGFPILIVTENNVALPKGAMVALIQRDNHIVFEVDHAAAKLLGLQISAKLLQLARKVY